MSDTNNDANAAEATQGAPDTVEGTSRDLDVVPASGGGRAALTVAPQVEAAELVRRLEVIKTAMDTAMQQGVDYGVIPGTDKPSLFKPGAEKLTVLFQLDVQVVNTKLWGPGDHLTVESKAVVFHAPTGARVASGEGACTTRERRYAYRKAELVCPSCKAEAIIKGKQEYGGGWVCWNKKGGCGSKFDDGDQAIESQPRGDVDNPDLPDLWNTVVKMAAKRARVDAVLNATGASAIFTQDAEDHANNGGGASDPGPEPEPQRPAPRQQPAPQDHEAALKALLGESSPLRAKRQEADKGMAALGAGPHQRLRELQAAKDERALNDLIDRANAAIDTTNQDTGGTP